MEEVGLKLLYFEKIPLSQNIFEDIYTSDAGCSYVIDFDSLECPFLQSVSAKFRTEFNRRNRQLSRAFNKMPEQRIGLKEKSFFSLVRSWQNEKYGNLNLFNQTFENSPNKELEPFPWVSEFYENLMAAESEPNLAFFSGLFVDEKPISLTFRLRSDSHCHGTSRGYDPTLGNLGVGIQEMVYFCNTAQSTGMRRIDFGRGDQRYKARFCNSTVPLVQIIASNEQSEAWKKSIEELLRGLELCWGYKFRPSVKDWIRKAALSGLHRSTTPLE
jgi:hypothetical protein